MGAGYKRVVWLARVAASFWNHKEHKAHEGSLYVSDLTRNSVVDTAQSPIRKLFKLDGAAAPSWTRSLSAADR